MKFLFISLAIVLCAITTNAFMFGSNRVSGCDPNPCKHDGKCQLTDPKDNTKFKCQCTDKFYGVNCKSSTGCSSNPCKAGTCVNDPKDLSKFKCKCPGGKVGEKCDKPDPCLNGKDCMNGDCDVEGTKAVCKCHPGWKTGFRGKCNHSKFLFTIFLLFSFLNKNEFTFKRRMSN
jgi:hypothetical protein